MRVVHRLQRLYKALLHSRAGCCEGLVLRGQRGLQVAVGLDLVALGGRGQFVEAALALLHQRYERLVGLGIAWQALQAGYDFFPCSVQLVEEGTGRSHGIAKGAEETRCATSRA